MKNKIYIWIFAFLLALPLMSAIDDTKPALDLFYLFVENVFGGVFVAGLGIAILLLVIGMISRMSITLLIFLVGLFLMVYSMGAIGGLAVLLFGLLAIYYFFSGLARLILARLEG